MQDFLSIPPARYTGKAGEVPGWGAPQQGTETLKLEAACGDLKRRA
jgi:hypothetical protein